MSKARVEQPDAESTNPALAVGGIGSIGALLALLLIRYAGLDPEVAFGVGMVAGPIVTSALIRAKVYSPATVARLLATRSGER